MMNYEWYIPLVARCAISSFASPYFLLDSALQHVFSCIHRPNLETATGAAIAATANLAQAGAKDEEIQRAKKASDGLASFVFPGKAYSPEPGGFMSGDLLRQNPLADFYAFTGLPEIIFLSRRHEIMLFFSHNYIDNGWARYARR